MAQCLDLNLQNQVKDYFNLILVYMWFIMHMHILPPKMTRILVYISFLIIVFSVSDVEISEEETKTRIGSLKKKAVTASARFRNSFTRKHRRSHSRVLSVEIEDVHDLEELKAVETLRQALISEELLPSKHDDYHKMLRFFTLLFFSNSFLCMVFMIVLLVMLI